MYNKKPVKNHNTTTLNTYCLLLITDPITSRVVGALHDGTLYQGSPSVTVVCQRLCLCKGHSCPFLDVVGPSFPLPPPFPPSLDCFLQDGLGRAHWILLHAWPYHSLNTIQILLSKLTITWYLYNIKHI